MTAEDNRPQWPTDKLTALRLGRRLVTEVPAAGPGWGFALQLRSYTEREE